jgi:hypothetical protein
MCCMSNLFYITALSLACGRKHRIPGRQMVSIRY